MSIYTIGSAIKSIREQKKLTQESLALKSKISYSALSKIERGTIKDPSIGTVLSICQALHIGVEELVERAQKPRGAINPHAADIQFIYCDVNGVLVRFFQRAFVSMAEKINRDVSQVETAFWHYNAAVNKGEMTTKQFNTAVAKRLDVASIDWESEYMAAIEAVPAMHTCLKELAPHIKIGLLTNIFPDFVDPMIKSALIPDLPYATIVDSTKVGAIKPEPAIYTIAEKMAGVQGSSILFIDDSRTNLMEAERHGWQVLWFDDYRPEESVKRVKSALNLL